MAQPRVERRLAAILAADVAGYSRLMGADEVGTLAALKAYRREIIDPAIASHKGRIVKTTGDGMLVEFASAVDAVTCAMAVQDKMAEGNGNCIPKITFRIGINVGDIIIDSDDLFGDGVNLAARVENECEPGGVCLSGNAFEQVRGKTDFAFDDLGERPLKNIDRPVRLYAVRRSGVTTAKSSDAAVIKLLASPEGDQSAAGIMREGPSVAILPFNNMSSDPEQEYFADGMVEDIITALARYPSLFVVARNSSFAYKGKSPDIRTVGRDLGVRYVLEGSVRRTTGKIRITAQLIEADTGRHLWAEKYDGTFDDVFELQDRIVSSVVGTIGPQIGEAEIARAVKRSPNDLSAYELLLRSKFAFRKMTKSAFEEAISFAKKALEIDPSFAAAAVAAASASGYRVAFGYSFDIEEDTESTVRYARRAIELDPFNVEGLALAGRVFACFSGDYQIGLELVEQACRDYPYSATAWTEAGWANLYCARPRLAIECIERALALSPRDPVEYDRLAVKAGALVQLGDYDQAILTARQSIRMNSNVPGPYRWMIAALALSGRIEEARRCCADLLAIEPTFRIGEWDARLRWVPEAKAASLKGFRLAGLPE
jgi:TolB-like protein/class 3 adenylate cyclase/Tfp pilus assembly protein PilF